MFSEFGEFNCGRRLIRTGAIDNRDLYEGVAEDTFLMRRIHRKRSPWSGVQECKPNLGFSSILPDPSQVCDAQTVKVYNTNKVAGRHPCWSSGLVIHQVAQTILAQATELAHDGCAHLAELASAFKNNCFKLDNRIHATPCNAIVNTSLRACNSQSRSSR